MPHNKPKLKMNNFDKLAVFIRSNANGQCPMCGEGLGVRSLAIMMYILGAGKVPADLRIRGRQVFDREITPGEFVWTMSGTCVSVDVLIDELKKFLEA